MRKTHSIFAFLLAAVLLVSVPAAAADYNPSPSRRDWEIIEGTDASGNDLTDPNLSDRLVLTPYQRREEMKQSYKRTDFEAAMNALTREAGVQALKDKLTPDMKPEYLTSAGLFYAHEENDSGFVHLPASIRFTTPLKKGDFCEVLFFPQQTAASAAFSGAEPHIALLSSFTPLADTLGQWSRIPSQLHEDGTVSMTVEQYGSYAIITYVVQEEPTAPTNPSQPTSPSTPTKPGVPESPQTGEAAHFPVMAAALFLLACTGMVLFVRNQEKRKS